MKRITLSLKEVEGEFVRRAKIAALTQSVTLKEFVLDAMRQAIEKALPQAIDQGRKRKARKGGARAQSL
jgi:hypothetical protein